MPSTCIILEELQHKTGFFNMQTWGLLYVLFHRLDLFCMTMGCRSFPWTHHGPAKKKKPGCHGDRQLLLNRSSVWPIPMALQSISEDLKVGWMYHYVSWYITFLFFILLPWEAPMSTLLWSTWGQTVNYCSVNGSCWASLTNQTYLLLVANPYRMVCCD